MTAKITKQIVIQTKQQYKYGVEGFEVNTKKKKKINWKKRRLLPLGNKVRGLLFFGSLVIKLWYYVGLVIKNYKEGISKLKNTYLKFIYMTIKSHDRFCKWHFACLSFLNHRNSSYNERRGC